MSILVSRVSKILDIVTAELYEVIGNSLEVNGRIFRLNRSSLLLNNLNLDICLSKSKGLAVSDCGSSNLYERGSVDCRTAGNIQPLAVNCHDTISRKSDKLVLVSTLILTKIRIGTVIP